MTWPFSNYCHAPSTTRGGPFVRSLVYAGDRDRCSSVLLGYPLAYAIAFKSGRWKNLMLVAVIAPFFTSFLVRTLAWKSILADNGFVVNVLQFLHVLGPDGRLLATSVAVVTGLAYNFLPFMVLPLYASLEKIDPRLLEAGTDLYASGVHGVPQDHPAAVLPGLVAGTLLTFIPAAGDYINAQLLGTPRQYMIGNVIDNMFLVQLDYPTAAALLGRADGRRSSPWCWSTSAAPEPRSCCEPRVQRIGRWTGRARDHGRGHRGAGLHVPADLFVLLMSFNQPASRLSYSFNAFTWDNWLHPCESAGMCAAVVPACRSASWPRSGPPCSAPWSPSPWCGTGSAAEPPPAC